MPDLENKKCKNQISLIGIFLSIFFLKIEAPFIIAKIVCNHKIGNPKYLDAQMAC